MGLLRWFLRPRRSDDEDEEPRRGGAKRGKHADPGVYRIEVDGEAGRMRGEGPPFSFWGSSRIILILSFLLWWIQPAGPMIAGYVGGRRAGSPMKAVVAALLPVVVIFAANAVYAHNVAAQQIDFVASLPNVVGDGAASILPFLAPYKDFMVAYMTGFVQALQSTFGMGTNGYLMVIIFSYIGGLIAEQTRRELYYRQGASQTVGLNLVQPIFGGRHRAEAYLEEDEELQEMRRPTRARAHARGTPVSGQRARRRHGTPTRFDDYHKVYGETDEGHSSRRVSHARARDEDEEDEEDASVRHAARERHEERRHHVREARAADVEESEEEDAEAVARREAKEKEARRPRLRSHEEEVALQRFVERALRNYDHSKL